MVLNDEVNRNMIQFQVNILDAAKMSWVKDPFWTTRSFIYQKLMILFTLTFTMCQEPHTEEWEWPCHQGRAKW